MTKKNYDLSEVIDLQINEYLLIDEEYYVVTVHYQYMYDL